MCWWRIAGSSNAQFLPLLPALVKALCLYEWTDGNRGRGSLSDRVYYIHTPTHTPLEMLGWLKWQKYLPFSSLLLMMADYTKTRVQRITMSFIGRRSPLPASPSLSSFISRSYKPLLQPVSNSMPCRMVGWRKGYVAWVHALQADSSHQMWKLLTSLNTVKRALHGQ